MRRVSAFLAVVVLAGCGGSVDGNPARTHTTMLSADGMSIDLPDGWTGRILVGSSGRPVLHAATFPVEANDTDDGRLAREAIGVNGMYLNVRDLGPGETDASEAHFDAGDFDPVGLCCHLREAHRDLGSEGERFRVTAVSGGDEDPELVQLNEALASLVLESYRAQPAQAATGEAIDAFGLHVNVPRGWEGGIARGAVHAADASVDIAITEFSAPDDASFVTGRLPLTIGPAEFVQPPGGTGYETGRSFLEAGREFQLWVRTPDTQPPASSLEQVNAILASFRAERGDFYRGRVEPASFTPAECWHTGSTGQAEIQPDGQATLTWAATVPYRDEGFQWPPHETLAALPPDGIVLTVQQQQYGSKGASPVRLPLQLSAFDDASFEGLTTASGSRSLVGHYGNFDLTVWALFGRAHPTREQLSRAQDELDRLQLPEWPRWALTSAER